MQTLSLNESFTNTGKTAIYYDVKYWNCVGFQQTQRETLLPGQNHRLHKLRPCYNTQKRTADTY
jgi:hypothetical protein